MILIQADQLSNVWQKVAPWIAEAINRREGGGDENLLDVLLAIARNQYTLWVDENFALVVQVTQFPRQKVATILYAGGQKDALVDAYHAAKPYLKQNGIQVVRTYGRPGWERALGLKRVGVILQETL